MVWLTNEGDTNQCHATYYFNTFYVSAPVINHQAVYATMHPWQNVSTGRRSEYSWEVPTPYTPTMDLSFIVDSSGSICDDATNIATCSN